MNGELPQGWAYARLGELCSKPQYGWTCRAAKTGSLRIVRTTDISKNLIDWSEVPYCEANPENVKKYQLRPNDILVSRAGSVGVSHRIDQVPFDAVFASYLIRFNTLTGINPKFVEYFLKSDLYWRAISDSTAGIAIPNVNASKLAAIELPLAPAAEQERIVEKLEATLTKVIACQKRLEKMPSMLKRLRQSVLAAACSGHLTADWREQNGCSLEDWRELRVSEVLAEPLANGRSVPDATQGAAVLRLTCLKNGRIDLTERKVGAWSEKEARRFFVAKGDFLVSRGNGSLSLVGRGGLVEETPNHVAYPDTLIRIRVRPSVLSTSFLRTIWNSSIIRKQIEAAAHTTAGIWKISQGDIEKFVLPVPSLPEQHEILLRVEQLLSFASRIEARCEQGQKRVGSISHSILAKAFNGELVPTEADVAKREDRSYEAAEQLLERISIGTKRDVPTTLPNRKVAPQQRRVRAKRVGHY